MVLRFLADRGLELNTTKCSVLSVPSYARKNKLYCVSASSIYMGGAPLPTGSMGDQFKNLRRPHDALEVKKSTTKRPNRLFGHLKGM